jgi:hypothetical protein
MTERTSQRGIPGLHLADRLALALLSSAIFAVALLMLRELSATRLNRWEIAAAVTLGIALGLVQLWLSFRGVLAMCLWAASGAVNWAEAPWTLPVWWLGTLPGGWLGLVIPGEQNGPGFLVLSLGMLACAAHGLTRVVHALEWRALGIPSGRQRG